MTRVSVDLPAPFSPTSATISPGWIAMSIPRRTSFSPNDLWMLRSSRCIFAPVGDPALQDHVGVGGELTGPDRRYGARGLPLEILVLNELHGYAQLLESLFEGAEETRAQLGNL